MRHQLSCIAALALLGACGANESGGTPPGEHDAATTTDASEGGPDILHQPDAGANANGPDFPRLGSLLIATAPNATNMGYDAGYITWASKMQVNVFGANWPGAGSNLYGGSREAFVKAVHAQSPVGARMFQYFITDNTLTPWPITNASSWELYAHGASGPCVANFFFATDGSICNTNQTLFPSADGKGLHLEGEFSEALVATLVNGTSSDAAPSLDGTFHDNTILMPTSNGDYNRDGTEDKTDDPNVGSWIRQGLAEGYTTLQKESSFITLGNLGGWGIANAVGGGLDISGLNGLVQGGVIEAVFGDNWSIDTWGTWQATMLHYEFCMQNTIAPKLVIVHASHVRTDGSGPTAFDSSGNPTAWGPPGQAMRYSLAFTLMDGGYYATTQNSDYRDTERNWFDELAVDPVTAIALAFPNVDAGLGYLGQPTDLPWPVPLASGVYERHFKNEKSGKNWVVLLNPKGNGQRTVTLDYAMKKITGKQAPTVNDGSTVTSVTLADADGLILQVL
ncbi:MAG TPA: hypothetical protein VGH28_33410 [Polyangiaceae bacterium]|jgi:hypothetical protein